LIQFVYHSALEREIPRLAKRIRGLETGFKSFELICQKHFHPVMPQQVIGPGKLHLVTKNDLWVMWKVELVVPKSGLRPNQFPRVWFAVKGSVIAFLCLATHTDNYDDGEMDRMAFSRVEDVF